MRYRISDYSEKNWGKITDIYSASIFKLENITMQRELKDSIWKKAIGDMKKVPTKVPEQKKKKIRYIKILKGLLRSPRYNKKKGWHKQDHLREFLHLCQNLLHLYSALLRSDSRRTPQEI